MPFGDRPEGVGTVPWPGANQAGTACGSRPARRGLRLRTAPAGAERRGRGNVRRDVPFADPRIDEASGLAVGIRSPGVVYVQNDSGDSARFFAVDAGTGRTLAVCRVPGARNIDWEDLATARDARGVPSVWLGDIGDNDEVRTSITVYRVDEPAVIGSAGSAGELDTVRPDVWRLRYPDGPHNAEALFIDALSARGYLVTKSLFGRSEVFELPPAPGATTVQVLSRAGSIDFNFTGTPGGPNLVGQLTATGASMSADGSRLVVRTYTDG